LTTKIISSYRRQNNFKDGDHNLYISARLGLWAKSFVTEQRSNEFLVMSFKSNETLHIANACINSSLFYFFWVATTDCWHVSKKDVVRFLPEISIMSSDMKERLYELSTILTEDIEKNKAFIGSKQVDHEYKHKYSKSIIDKIDFELSKIFNLTKEEYEYVINFALKYRMNDYYDEYIKGLTK